jgi:hypothetical protein
MSINPSMLADNRKYCDAELVLKFIKLMVVKARGS